MKRFIAPIALILIAGILFFTFISPTMARIDIVKADLTQYDEALSKSRELQGLRDSLLSKYNTFSQTDLDDLKKIVPDHVDNVRLIIEIDNIASQYGMTVRDALVATDSTTDETIFESAGRQQKDVTLSFSVVAPYQDFLAFLSDLEQSLRIVDIEGIEFKASQADLNEYFVDVKTYWLSSEQ